MQMKGFLEDEPFSPGSRGDGEITTEWRRNLDIDLAKEEAHV